MDITVASTVNPALQSSPSDADQMERWPVCVSAAHRQLKLHFNAKEFHAPTSNTD
jgi:hypothetical protein